MSAPWQAVGGRVRVILGLKSGVSDDWGRGEGENKSEVRVGLRALYRHQVMIPSQNTIEVHGKRTHSNKK